MCPWGKTGRGEEVGREELTYEIHWNIECRFDSLRNGMAVTFFLHSKSVILMQDMPLWNAEYSSCPELER